MKKSLLALSLCLVFLLAGIAHAAPIPATVDMLKVDGLELTTGATNRLSLDRDGSFDVKVVVTAQQDVEDVHVRAEIFGYEYGDFTLLGAASHNADWELNTTYPVNLRVDLPDDVEVDEYKLRVTITNRDDDEIQMSYNIKIDAERHSMKIRDVLLYPGESVKAGSALLTSVRVENLGQDTEEDVKVRVSVPELGVASSTYLDRVKADDEESTEELYMRVPSCAEAGEYDLKVEVTYDNGHMHTSQTSVLSVQEDELCNLAAAPAAETVTAAPVITVVNQAPASSSTLSTLRNGLEVALLVLVGILVVIGLVIGFTKLKASEDEE